MTKVKTIRHFYFGLNARIEFQSQFMYNDKKE